MTHAPARRRIAWFIAVGSVAAVVHWTVVVLLVEHRGWQPLLANAVGWLIAFGVSFAGHHRLTFRGHRAAPMSAVARLFAVSTGGFAINQTAYALLLNRTAQRYDVLLAAVLIGVAALTYLAGRHWVFLRRE